MCVPHCVFRLCSIRLSLLREMLCDRRRFAISPACWTSTASRSSQMPVSTVPPYRLSRCSTVTFARCCLCFCEMHSFCEVRHPYPHLEQHHCFQQLPFAQWRAQLGRHRLQHVSSRLLWCLWCGGATVTVKAFHHRGLRRYGMTVSAGTKYCTFTEFDRTMTTSKLANPMLMVSASRV